MHLRAADAAGGFRQGIAVRDLTVQGAGVDLSGELDIPLAGRTPLRAVLAAGRIDIDALLAALAETAPAPPRTREAAAWVIPSDRLPLAALAQPDFYLRATSGELRLGGVAFRNAAVVATATAGRLAVGPFTASLPGGGIALAGSATLLGRLPSLALSLRAAGIPAGAAAAGLGLPDNVAGTLSVIADLRGTGTSWHDLASGLTGQVRLAMSGGELDNRLLDRIFGPALQLSGLPAPGAGAPASRTASRCLALSLDSRDGLVSVHDFVLDTPALKLQGDGALQLRDERLALHLLAIPHTGMPPPLPVRIGGVFARTTIYTDQGTPVPPVDILPSEPCAAAADITRAAAFRP